MSSNEFLSRREYVDSEDLANRSIFGTAPVLRFTFSMEFIGCTESLGLVKSSSAEGEVKTAIVDTVDRGTPFDCGTKVVTSTTR